MKIVCILLGVLAVGTVGAAETSVLYEAGGGELAWDTRRDRGRMEQEFSAASLRLDPDRRVIDWRFVPADTAFNDVFLDREIAYPFSTVRVRLANPGAAFSLALKVVDANGAEWTVPPTPVAAGAEVAWYEFPRTSWGPASWSHDPDENLDFPVSPLAVIAFDLQRAAEYHVRLERIEVVRPDPPVVTLLEFAMPRRIRAGEGFEVDLAFRLDRPCSQSAAGLVFLRAGHGSTRVELPFRATELEPGREYRFEAVRLQLPLYSYGGECSVALRIGEAHVEYGTLRAHEEITMATVESREIGQTDARVRAYCGKPTLYVNGEPHNGMAYMAYGPSLPVFQDFADAGVALFSISATPTESGYGLARTSWTGPGEYDFSQLDERVRMILTARPDAFIFPRLYLHAPKWWSEQHPDDIVLMDPGDGDPVVFQHSGPKPAPSWASEPWRRDTIEGLRHLVRHVEQSPYADRIIGYHLASGTTEEWMMWGANEGEWVDYSPANLRRFRDWLRERYGDDRGLQQAWADPDVTLENATIPTRRQREACAFGSLRDPRAERPVIDYYEYHSFLVGDTIEVLARAVKDIAGRDKTVGVFYGYLLQLCGEQRQQNAGHLALGKVLASPDVDFLCSPTSYAFREPGGEGTSHFMSLLGSVKLHGKLWFDENDIRTSLAPGPVGSWGKTESIDGDLVQQDKELANVLVNGVAQWWFDVGNNRYDDPRLMAHLAHLTRAADRARDLDRSPVEEMALVVDETSLCRLRVGDPLGRELLVTQLPELHRCGAPVAHYLSADLPQLTDHRLLILACSFAPDAEQRRAVAALKGGNRTLVFLWNSGIYGEDGLSAEAASAFTGVRLRLASGPLSLRVQAADDAPESLAGMVYGPERTVSPVLVPDDPDARVLGRFADGTPALVVREHGDWTAVYSAAPLLPSPLFRHLAAQAGVHLYVDTPDVVWASRDLVGVSVAEPGVRGLRLPRAATVTDLYSGAELGRSTAELSVDFDARQTRVFVLSDD